MTRLATETYVAAHPGTPGKSPADIGGVLLDFDASLITSATVADGAAPTIAQVNAVKTGTRSLAQADATMPNIKTSNGYRYLDFNRSVATKLATDAALGATSVTLMAVLGDEISGRVMIESELAGGTGYFGIQSDGTFYVNKGAGDVNFSAGGGITDLVGPGKPRLAGLRIDNTTVAKSSLGRNAGTAGTGTPPSGAIVNKKLWIGGRSNGSSNALMRLFRLCIFSKYLTDQEYADLQDFLAHKYRL